jgi:hypothetical protein
MTVLMCKLTPMEFVQLGDKCVAHIGSEKWLEYLTAATSDCQDRWGNIKMNLGD